jgi:hypothetical protein
VEEIIIERNNLRQRSKCDNTIIYLLKTDTMKTLSKIFLVVTALLFNLTLNVSCQKEEAAIKQAGDEKVTTTTNVASANCSCVINPSDTITQAEIDMLNYRREEEKFARDVYLAMYELYSIPIFRNISKSEQHHMNQVLCLLQHYNLPDPASPDTGVFNNSELQQLYDDLIVQGNLSLVEALTVGATIEDKDIFDLETDMTNTTNPAILNIFGRLSCASGNHIRSFSAWLTNQGVTYIPQYISQEEYDAIIALPHQFCGGPY